MTAGQLSNVSGTSGEAIADRSGASRNAGATAAGPVTTSLPARPPGATASKTAPSAKPGRW
ncbi:hypothetical protein D3C72_1367990 [compost metagenome]